MHDYSCNSQLLDGPSPATGTMIRRQRPNRRRARRRSCLLLLSCPALLQAANAQQGDDDRWHVDGELFLWGAGIGGQSAGGDIEIPFEEIFDSLDMAFMGTLLASRNDWALAAEIVYLDVSGTGTLATSPLDVSGHVSLKNLISTLAGGYRLVDAEAVTLHGVFGARYLGLEPDLRVSIGNLPDVVRSGSESIWDGVVGIRGAYRFADSWALTYYADVGTGDSDRTWHATAAANYRFDRITLVLGYAHLEWDFGGRALVHELEVSGPYAGIQLGLR